MKQIPEDNRDVRKLLYEQAPLLIEKLKGCEPKDTLIVVQAIAEILKV